MHFLLDFRGWHFCYLQVRTCALCAHFPSELRHINFLCYKKFEGGGAI